MRENMDSNMAFMAKGKAFSKASSEIMNLLAEWMKESNISEELLRERVRRDDFTIHYACTTDNITTTLYAAGVPLGIPFICTDILHAEQYRVDLSLILLCIANKFDDIKLQNKCIGFINKYLLEHV